MLTTLPRIFAHVVCQVNSFAVAVQRFYVSGHVLRFPWQYQRGLCLPAATVISAAAQAAVVCGCMSMSTRSNPWGSGAVEIL